MKRIITVMAALALMSTTAFAAEWTGTILKKDGKYWFQSGDKMLAVTNGERATGYEGKTVKVTGEATGDAVMLETVTETAAA